MWWVSTSIVQIFQPMFYKVHCTVWHCYVHKLPRCLPQGALMIDIPLYVSPLELQGIQNFFLTTCPQGPQKRK